MLVASMVEAPSECPAAWGAGAASSVARSHVENGAVKGNAINSTRNAAQRRDRSGVPRRKGEVRGDDAVRVSSTTRVDVSMHVPAASE